MAGMAWWWLCFFFLDAWYHTSGASSVDVLGIRHCSSNLLVLNFDTKSILPWRTKAEHWGFSRVS